MASAQTSGEGRYAVAAFAWRFAMGAVAEAALRRLATGMAQALQIERLRQSDLRGPGVEAGIPEGLGRFMETHSPILKWLKGQD